jgi:hypothetical protein
MSIRRHSTVRALEHAGFAEFVDARQRRFTGPRRHEN